MAITIELAGLADSFPPTVEMYLGAYPIELVTFGATVTNTIFVTSPNVSPPVPVPPAMAIGNNLLNTALGIDFACLDGLDPYFTQIYGPQVLVQDCYHRLTVRKGNVPWDTNIGESINDLLNLGVSPEEIQTKAAAMEGELLQDDRVQSCTVSINFNTATSTGTITVTIQPQQPGTAFQFVIGITKLTTQLLSISGVN